MKGPTWLSCLIPSLSYIALRRKAFLPGRFGFVCECDRCEEEDQAGIRANGQHHCSHRAGTEMGWRRSGRCGLKLCGRMQLSLNAFP